MMNELLLLFHVIAIVAFAFLSLRVGKEALTTFIALQAVLANLFVVKQIELFGLTVTCADAFIVGTILSLNLVTEYFGKKETNRAMLITFISLVFFVIMSQFQLFYAPSTFDKTNEAFIITLKPFPRIAAASFVAFLIVIILNAKLYSFLKKHTNSLMLRMGISFFVSQTLDTILFTFLGLYGIVQSIWHIIIFSLIVKLIASAIITPLTLLSKKIKR